MTYRTSLLLTAGLLLPAAIAGQSPASPPVAEEANGPWASPLAGPHVPAPQPGVALHLPWPLAPRSVSRWVVEDRLAVSVPVGLAFGGGIETSETVQVHPTVLVALLAHEHAELNPSAKASAPINERSMVDLVALNIGVGLGPELRRWVVRPRRPPSRRTGTRPSGPDGHPDPEETKHMPYVSREARDRLEGGGRPETPGELNYVLTRIVDRYLADRGGVRYAHLNDAVGALECAKLELYRRIGAPYEDQKRAEAGDVYRSAGTEG